MMEVSFVHLRTHTEYSLIDSVIRIEDLLSTAREQNMFAVGMCDQNNLFATIKFYQTALKNQIKPIIGVDLLISEELHDNKVFLITLFCQNQDGFRSLSELISKSYIEGQVHDIPRILYSWLTPEICKNLIALQNYQSYLHALLSAQSEELYHYHSFLTERFPDRWYIELSRTGKSEEQHYEHLVLPYAKKHQIPLLATNNVRFLTEEDFEAHEARVCIQEGVTLDDPKRVKNYTEQQYFRSAQEMQEIFSDLPSALQNTVYLAQRCSVTLTLGKTYLPNYPTGELTPEAYLREKSIQGLHQYLMEKNIDAEKKKDYQDRLNLELDVINQMGFAGYFLIVADFIQWSKSQQIPVGPGRGSGAGSLVAFMLGITNIDPLLYDLLFERFLNPERISLPDFDIDFCMEGRDRVIDYVAKKYGRDSVAQIITYGTMAAKGVIRDVGRILGYPYGFVDKIAKLIPFELGITLEKAMAQEVELQDRYKKEEDVKTLFDLALKLEGLVRNAGKHAGGIVIAPSKLTDFTPLYCEANSESLVSQFDKDDVETVGLVKFDFLGLRTLTIIDWAVKNINLRADHPSIDINKIPLDDKATYDLLQQGNSTAIFQLESRGMKDLLKRLKPDCFEDIIALVALFRPGPLQSGMVEDFIQRKHGAKIEYPHPSLEPILQSTYGVILYQEQVMQIAQVLAGYTLGAADILRRAMGKKKPEEMAYQREIFVTGAKERGIPAHTAETIFDLMEKFAGYGFNKSHSAAYAFITYQTAWLKTHYPAEFMAAVLSSDMDNTDKIVGFIEECAAMGLKLAPPNINEGNYHFTVRYANLNSQAENIILYGLGAVKGSGANSIYSILKERDLNGVYQDLFDFCARNDLQKINKRFLEAAVKSGSFDCFEVNRATLWASLDKAYQHAEQKILARKKKQQDLFGLDLSDMHEKNHYLVQEEWPLTKKLQAEKETLGWYFSGHPVTSYKEEIKQFHAQKISSLVANPDKTIKIIAQFVARKNLLTKKGNRLIILSFEDETGKIDSALFQEDFEKYRSCLISDAILLLEGVVEVDHFTQGIRLNLKNITSIEQARTQQAKALQINLTSETAEIFSDEKMKNVLQQFPGNLMIHICFQEANQKVTCQLGNKWRVNPSEDLMHHLSNLFGSENVKIVF